MCGAGVTRKGGEFVVFQDIGALHGLVALAQSGQDRGTRGFRSSPLCASVTLWSAF